MVKLGRCARNGGWSFLQKNIFKSLKLNRREVGRSDKNLTKTSPPSKTIKNKQVGWFFSNPAL